MLQACKSPKDSKPPITTRASARRGFRECIGVILSIYIVAECATMQISGWRQYKRSAGGGPEPVAGPCRRLEGIIGILHSSREESANQSAKNGLAWARQPQITLPSAYKCRGQC